MNRTARLLIVVVAALMALLLVGAVAAQEATPEATAVVSSPAPADTAPASGGMLTGLRHLHSFVRWVLVVVTVIVIIKLVLGLVQNAPYDRLTERLMLVWGISLMLQWLIGLIFFVVFASQIGGFGNLQPYNWLHVIVLTVAVGLAEMRRRFKDAPDHSRYRANLTIVVLVLVLVVVGVGLLPYGWRVFPPS